MIIERNHRLFPDAYRGKIIVAFTACIRHRILVFKDDRIVSVFKDILLAQAREFVCSIPAYVFMPDHCHIILQGMNESSHCLHVMREFKHRTGYWLHRNLPEILWQKDFYDHIIRDQSSFEKHIRYLLENPVRKGIVCNWKDYPFKGSTVFNLEEW